MGAVTDEVGPMEQHSIKVIARIRSDFKTKFGVPRQSGLVEALRARIVFEPEYRNADALRGIEGFSHLWLIWQFSEAVREDWSPTVRPPRLGGNERMGVFATRSPFRPNAIGLSCVRLDGVEQTAEGSVLLVSGADLMDGTPIYDIKPYLPYADCKPEASGGAARRWRWTSRRSFYRACRRTSAMPSQAFSRRTRGRTTRAIRSVFTAWRLPGLRCASASRTALCMWWR